MTTPNGQIPDGSMTKYGTWRQVQTKTQEDWKAGEQNKWEAGYKPVGDWGAAVGGAINAHGQAIQDLQDQTQVLEGVVGFGQWTDLAVTLYPSGTTKTHNAGTQTGPTVGCTLVSPGVVQLGSKGLWDIIGRFYFGTYSGIFAANFINYMVEVSNDNFATIFSSALAQIIPDSTGGITANVNSGTTYIHTRVVVPDPGYRVRWRILMVPQHKMGGGVNFNQIGVLKLSNELGPGMRLRSPYLIEGNDWVKLGTMTQTGGGVVVDDQFTVPTAMSQGRVDVVVIGDRPFSVQLRNNGTAVQTSTNLASHHITATQALAANDKLDVWVRGDQTNIVASNSTWLTLMNMDTIGGGTAPGNSS